MTWLAIGSAFWLGLFTAISPCPLATNIAAISFIGRQVGNRRNVLASGLLYTLGRTLTYVALGAVLAGGLLAVAEVSRFLQKYMNEILGPVMILLGMVLLGWIGSGLSMNLAGPRVQERAAKGGVLWAGLLGILFALSFCPVSAGLFFAGLIPLTLKEEFTLPASHGLWCGYGPAGAGVRVSDRVFGRVPGQGLQPLDASGEMGPTRGRRAVRVGGRLLLLDPHLRTVTDRELRGPNKTA